MRKLLLLASTLLAVNINANAQVRWKTFGTVKNYGWNEGVFVLDSNKIWSQDVHYDLDTVDSFKVTIQQKFFDKSTGFESALLKKNFGFNYGKEYRINAIGNGNFNYDVICFSYQHDYFMSGLCLIDTSNSANFLFDNYLVKYNASTGLPFFTKKFSKFKDRESIVSIKMLSADTIALATNWLKDISYYGQRRMGFYLLDTNANVLFADTFAANRDELCVNAVMDAQKNSYLSGYIDTFTKDNGPGYEHHRKGILRKVDRNGKSIVLGDAVQHSSILFPYIMANGHQFTDGKFMTVTNTSTNYLWTDDFAQWGLYNQWQIGFYDTNLTLIRSDSILRLGYGQITGVRSIAGNRYLLYGFETKDTNRQINGFDYTVYGFATVLDSNGKIIWDRRYNFRNKSDHYFTSAEQDTDGSIYIAGVVFENDSLPRANVLLRLDSLGCFDNSCYPMDVVEIEGLQKDDLVISPNPASNVVRFQFKDVAYCGGFMDIYNANGQLVQRLSMHSLEHSIDVSSWPKGTYFLSYNHRKYFYKGKMVVQ
jgi:hypothetical protein